jgi:hypothetical protein
LLYSLYASAKQPLVVRDRRAAFAQACARTDYSIKGATMKTGLTVFAAIVATTSLAQAQPLPKEGRYDYTACWSEVGKVIAFSKTHRVYSYEMTGTTRSNPAGGFGDKNTFHCIGVSTTFEGKGAAKIACEAVDAEGDKRLSQLVAATDGQVTREHIAGTGKYEGMSSTTAVAPLGRLTDIPEGTFQDCNQQTGTYKLK